MIKPVLTLVRVNSKGDTYVSRSFDRLDSKAVECIKGCIREDCEDWLSDIEVEVRFLVDFSELIKDFKDFRNPENDNTDFERRGIDIWEYSDEVEIIKYVLHQSILEIPDPTPNELYKNIPHKESILKNFVHMRLLELMAGRSVLDLSELDDDKYGKYDTGITLYDKHGFFETGLPQIVTVGKGNVITIRCQGTESGDYEDIPQGDLESWSQISVLAMIESVLKDIENGILSIADGGKVGYKD